MGYAAGTALLSVSLLVMLISWKWNEKTISVTDIRSKKGELFYWFTILISNTLGTALGDFLADSSGLGFSGGALLIGILLIITIGLYYYTSISHIVLFWAAFILTRPFGATLGDLLTKPHIKGGLNYGTLGASIILFAILLIFILDERNTNLHIKMN